MPLQIRRGTELQRQAMTVPLASGELLYVTDDQRLYVGNGSTLGGVQITGYTNENAIDAIGAALTAGNHSGITFTYGTTQDIANRIDATVDLSGYEGTISASAFKGSVFADDSTILIDAISGTIVGPVVSNVTGNLTGNVTGDLTGNTIGYHFGDVKGSIFADDSTLLIDAVAGRIVGPIFSNVTGNVTGIITGLAGSTITGDVTGLITGTAGSTLDGTVNGTLVGTSIGFHSGDMKGSVFADDSSMLVNAIDKTIVADTILTTEIIADNLSGLNVRSPEVVPFAVNAITDGTTAPFITLNSSRGTIYSPTDTNASDFLGGYKVEGYKSGIMKFATAITVQWESDANFTFTYPKSKILFLAGDNSNSLGLSASLTGSGTFSANVLQTGVYVTTPSDTRPTGVKGMIIFNDTSSKFQGFDGTSWVDLS